MENHGTKSSLALARAANESEPEEALHVVVLDSAGHLSEFLS